MISCKQAFRALLLSLAATGSAYAGNAGNVTAQGTGTCTIPKGSTNFLVSVFQNVNGTNTNVYKIAILNNISGFAQPQYIVDTLNQVGSASSGSAGVFFLGSSFTGTWSGSIRFDGFADFVIDNLTITTGTGANTCTLTFSGGLAPLIF